MKELTDILRLVSTFADEPFAFATLVRVKGSSYRRPGARMAIFPDGKTAGSLSAGCIEDEVAEHAREVLRSGKPKLIAFDTRRRFGCNGSIEIFIERMNASSIRTLREQFVGRRSCTLQTVFESSEDEFATRVVIGNAQEIDGGFVQTVEPAIRLLVIGDGPDANALAAQATLLGWNCECAESIAAWRGAVDERTAAIIATHNYGRDCAALRHLAPLGLRYLGVVGPRRRRDELLVDVLDTGAVVRADLFAPAGLHLGAETAEEIALSIIAEIQMVFAHGSGERLRDRKAPIHGEPECAEACAESAR